MASGDLKRIETLARQYVELSQDSAKKRDLAQRSRRLRAHAKPGILSRVEWILQQIEFAVTGQRTSDDGAPHRGHSLA